MLHVSPVSGPKTCHIGTAVAELEQQMYRDSAGALARRAFRGLCRIAAIFCAILAMAGCATQPPDDDPDALEAFAEINDPYEPLNRAVFEANLLLDRTVVRPAAHTYLKSVPRPVRVGISNFLENLKAPVTFANQLLQGETGLAADTFARFCMNSTVGLLGFIDVASEFGIEEHGEDFGQTLASWGIGSGPYLVLPVLGPSNFRDAGGRFVDSVGDPLIWTTLIGFRMGTAALSVLDFRARNHSAFNDLEENSLDFYAAARSLYRQYRAREIDNRRLPRVPPPSVPARVITESVR